MNEPTNGDKPANGDERPPRRLSQVIGTVAFAAALYLALRPEWVQQLAGIPPTSAEAMALQSWLAGLFVLVAVWLRYHIEQGEAALGWISPTRAAQLSERRTRGAVALQKLVDRRDLSLQTARSCSLLLLALSVVVAVVYAGSGLATVAKPLFPKLLAVDVAGIANLLVFVVTSLLMLVGGETLPRALAGGKPEHYALRRAWLLLLIRRLLSGPVSLAMWMGRVACGWLHCKPLTPATAVTEEQLRTLLEASEEQGELEEEEREMIHSVFDFRDSVVREVMTPRTDMDTVDAEGCIEDVVKIVSETGHSRIPVHRETVDHIVGVIHAKDLLKHLTNGDRASLDQIMRPVYVVPENKNLGDLLAEFRSRRNQIAIVQDEYGGTAGVVTIEDIVEEIVGEIVDEYDEEEQLWSEAGEGEFLIDGRMNLDDVNELLGADLESEEFDTVGGLVFGLIGHQPSPGETVDDGRWRFEVKETDGRRVQKVLVQRLPEATEEVAGQQDA